MKTRMPSKNVLATASATGVVRPQASQLAAMALTCVPLLVMAGCQRSEPTDSGGWPPDTSVPPGAQPDGAAAGMGQQGGQRPAVADGLSPGDTVPGPDTIRDEPPADTSGDLPSVDAEGGWCQAKAVIQTHCSRCHGAEPAFGAPMSLASHGDWMAASPVDGRKSLAVALERIDDPQRPMPPAPNPPLQDDERAVLMAWAEAGAPAAACNDDSDPPPVTDPDCIDCGDYTCEDGTPMRFLAHGQPTAGDETPFDGSEIGGALSLGDPNYYECFYFKAPWGPDQIATGFRPVIDNQRIVHHWLLYASDNAPFDLTDGGMRGECQLQGDPNRVLLGGWAPGTPGRDYPTDVGQELPHGPNTYVTLEVHYYNPMPGQPAPDRSGAELCLASAPRPNVATQHWLGTEKINVAPGASQTTGDTCTPNMGAGETATLMSVTPHMHEIGSAAKLEILRSSGETEVIHDGGFTFDNQTTYVFDPPITVNSGDRLRASCTFENPTATAVGFGDGTNEEMCYLFVTAYPAGSLHNGRNGCFGPLCVPGSTRRCIDNENILDAAGGL